MKNRDLIFDALHKLVDEARCNPTPNYRELWSKLSTLLNAVEIIDVLDL